MPQGPGIEYVGHTLAEVRVKVNGSTQPVELMHAIVECVVEKSLNLPNCCSIRYNVQPIEDADLKILDSEQLREGASIEVDIGYDPELEPVFKGEIVSTEVDLNAGGASSITIRCLDKMHRLHRGKKQKTFKQMTDSDIFSKVASELGLTAVADATTEVHDWIVQDNLSDWEFLQMLGKRSGRRVYCSKHNHIHFEKHQDVGSANHKLKWGEDLLSYRPRTSSSHQVEKVIVRGWDPKTKQAIVGESKPTPEGVPQTGEDHNGPKVGTKSFGAAHHYVVDNHVRSKSQADTLAQSVFDDMAHSYMEAEALCLGAPKIHPGDVVEFEGVGKRFGGKFKVSAVTHTIGAAVSFTTQVSIEGKKSGSLLSILKEHS